MRFETAEDRRIQRKAQTLIAQAGACKIDEFPDADPVDFLARRESRPIFVGDVRARDKVWLAWPDTYVNLAKANALKERGAAFGCPAIYFLWFFDALVWISITRVLRLEPTIGGHKRPRPGATTDIEPIFNVPTEWFRLVTWAKR